jgi:hypothetical protein
MWLIPAISRKRPLAIEAVTHAPGWSTVDA